MLKDDMWFIATKHGELLGRGWIQKPTSYNTTIPVLPPFNMYTTRDYARLVVKEIKSKMTKEVWDTWKLKVIRYRRVK